MTLSRRIFIFLLIAILFSCFNGFGYHIAGGDFTYRWISGNTYEIKLTLYRDCSNPSAADFDNAIIVGVYNKVGNQLVDSVILNLGVKDSLNLSGTGCVPPPQVCMQFGEYIASVALPSNPAGYYIVWERCCRNNTILNLINPEQEGMAFYAEIPNPALHSSSPLFNSQPLPFICVNQFFRFGFQAADPDGDSLVYILSNPLNGGHTSQFNPNPFSIGGSSPSPTAPLPAPYSNTSWAAGFGLNNICGSSSPLIINSATGEIEVSPDLQGIFAMAVEVREYRNGNLIGLVRREIEFTVIACTGNSAPLISPAFSSIKIINAFATDTISFKVNAVDVEGDSVFILHFGDIFHDSPTIVIDPPYAVSNNVSGNDSATTYFTWTTGCQHISTMPYHVRFEASDNGCPLVLTAVRKYDIKVHLPPSPAKSNLLCIELLDENNLKIRRISDTVIVDRYFSHFTLYRSINGSSFVPFKIIDELNPVEIYDSSAVNNKVNDYCYYLSSFNICGMESDRSDTLCSVSALNTNRNYIESVSVIAQNSIRLKWESFSGGPYSIYYIYKKNDETSQMQMVTSLSDCNAFIWDDIDVFTALHSYCYGMMNKDVCGNESDTSLIACSILLKGEAVPFLNKLNWSHYVNWRGGVDSYDILRKGNNVTAKYDITASIRNGIDYFDRNLSFDNGSCNYYIKAIEGTGGNDATALSNEIVLVKSPFLFVPSAFTPNNDGTNDNFFSLGSFVEDFQIVVYDRWGQIVFNTQNIEAHWDGQFKGKMSPTGVYFYKLDYKGFNEINHTRKTGSITLIR